MLKRQTARNAFFRLSAVLAATAFLVACAPGQSPEQIQAQVETSVAQTVEAKGNNGTAVALTVSALAPASTSAPLSTSTPLILPSLTPVLPSLTPFVIPRPGGGGGGGGGGGSGGSGSCRDPKRCCEVVDQEPKDWPDPHSILKPGDKLDVKFDIKNIGSMTWDPAWTWTFFKSAVDTTEPDNAFLTTNSVGLQDTLGVAVEKNHYITLGIELTAPDYSGREPIKISTRWAITGDGVRFCTPFSYIEVVRPGDTP